MEGKYDMMTYGAHAAQTIQRHVRGHQCRLKLWSPYGKLTQRQATKIQKTWRGLIGRRRGYDQYIWYRNYKATQIQGLSALFQARRMCRKLRAEHANNLVTTIQRNFRGRMGRQAFLEYKMKVYNQMARRIGSLGRGYLGRRRFRGIKRRMGLGMGGMTAALRRDYEASEGYKKKITIEAQPVGGLDKWALYDAALAQLLGTHRQHIGLDIATVLARRHPEMALAPVIVFISLFFQWSAYTPRQLVREDLLEEALEVLQVIRERDEELLQPADLKNLDPRVQEDLPHSLRGADPVSFHHGHLLMDELEYSHFRSMFRCHGYDPYCLCIMSTFAIAKATVYERTQPAVAVKQLDRARGLLKRAVAKTRNIKEDLYLRNQVFDHLIDTKLKELVTKSRTFSECFLRTYRMPSPNDPPKQVDNSASGRAANSALPRVTATTTATRHGDMLVIRAEYDLGPLAAALKRSRLTLEDLGYKWRLAMCIRPMVILPRDVKGLEGKAVAYCMRALRKSQLECEKRGLHRNVGEYLCDNARLMACKSRFAPDHRLTPQDEFVQFIPPNWDSSFSHSRLSLPFLEYRHVERNLAASEDYGIRMIQRAYLGFQGRALYRRLKLRYEVRCRQQAETRVALQRLADVRVHRFKCATLIQAIFRGHVWRVEITNMHRAALRCQTRFRVYKAQCWYYEERRRLALGPEVVEMLRRGVEISERRMMLVIYRCGSNYKCLGEDLLNNLRYDGHVYAPDIPRILEDHNNEVYARLGDTTAAKEEKVNVWQHEKVAEVIAKTLSLTKVIQPVTRDLGLAKRDTKLALVPLKTAKGYGVQDHTRLERYLLDEEPIYQRYKRSEAHREKVRNGGDKALSKYVS